LPVRAQQQSVAKPAPPAETPVTAVASVPLPAGYVIGAEDVLSIVFWQEKNMSADVVVRPDGKISLPLLNDVQAVGLTPDQLRAELVKGASKYIADPNATVVVKEIRSRKVFITGNVGKAGTYPLIGEMNVLQLIALAGGLLEYADSKNITIMRNEGGQQQSFKFNYKDVTKQKHVEQNITLKPGDTVIVP
ncbi:MAG TPA: polysaccharide biosynthesis/export family protein, partial [Vicinamibacterales bacterium]